MKIQLIDSRPGVAQAIILKEWMRIGLSICLLGLPVILGYFSIQIADARNAEFAKDSPTPALRDEFDFSSQTPVVQSAALGGKALAVQHFIQRVTVQNRDWHAEAQTNYGDGQATVKYQALPIYAKYGDVLKNGQIIALAAAIGYTTESSQGKTRHKNGRVVDPASYIHSTIR